MDSTLEYSDEVMINYEILQVFPEAQGIINDLRNENNKPNFYSAIDNDFIVHNDTKIVMNDGILTEYRVDVYMSGDYKLVRARSNSPLQGDWTSGSGYSAFDGSIIVTETGRKIYKEAQISPVRFTILNGGFDMIDSISDFGSSTYIDYLNPSNSENGFMYRLSYIKNETSNQYARALYASSKVGLEFTVGNNTWNVVI